MLSVEDVDVEHILYKYETSEREIQKKLRNLRRNTEISLELDTSEALAKTKKLALKRNKNFLQLIEVRENLTWLDLSFNHLTSISNDLSILTNLKILYLHGNKINEFAQVLPYIRSLRKLYSLTLHGNPIEERKGYRTRILLVLPLLKKLDFINVSNELGEIKSR